MARLVQATVGVPAVGGNALEILCNGDEIFPAMLEAIRSAERSVLFETYVYWEGDIAEEFAAALADRARDGVEVLVLVDWFGGRLMANELIDEIEEAGGRFAWFRPPGRVAEAAVSLDEGLVGQHRTHRKVLVCDGRVGFTGGVGIAEEWTGDARDADEWRDTHFRIEGPAVPSLVSAFATNWHEATGGPLPLDIVGDDERPGHLSMQVVRGQPGRFVSDVALVMRALVDAASKRIWVSTAYLVPDEELVARFKRAYERGVDVQLLVPGPNIDKRVSQVAARAAFDDLHDAGAVIYEYQPTMLHTKIVVVDDVAVIGSANLNMRSFSQDDEVVVVVHDEDVADTLVSDMADDIRHAEYMDPARFEERGPKERIAEMAVRTIRRFM